MVVLTSILFAEVVTAIVMFILITRRLGQRHARTNWSDSGLIGKIVFMVSEDQLYYCNPLDLDSVTCQPKPGCTVKRVTNHGPLGVIVTSGEWDVLNQKITNISDRRFYH